MQPADIQTPASPLGSFPELAQMYRSSFQLPLSNAQMQAQSAHDAITIANQKKAEEIRQRHAQDLLDPNKYQRIKKADGGFAFVGPDGKEISASAYADLIGKNPKDVLKDSENPIDIAYSQDFDNLQDFLRAVTTGDKEKSKQYYALNPGLEKMKPDEVIRQFKEAYPTVYGGNKAGVPLGQTAIPTVRKQDENPLAAYGITAGQ